MRKNNPIKIFRRAHYLSYNRDSLLEELDFYTKELNMLLSINTDHIRDIFYKENIEDAREMIERIKKRLSK